jgi:DNA-directed RNA polymerase specialized sigma24 family protein
MTDTPEWPAVAHDGATVLRGMLASLPATQAGAVAMASIYGMTARQVADAEGIPWGTARKLIRDGMRELRDAHLPAADCRDPRG